MADERTIDQVSSEELFQQAVAPPPAEPQPPIQEPPAPVPPPTPTPEPTPESQEAIPSWRLREEAEARRLAEDRARMLEDRLNQVAHHLQQQQKQPDFFDNPDQATQALILRTLQPYAEENRRQMMAMGKMIASSMHGADKVDEAEEAFLQAREAGTLDTMDYERVVQAPNRYDEVVQWHRRQNTLSAVGNDPQAWLEAQIEAKMNDPQFQAKMLEKIRGTAATKPGTVQIPPSLSRATGIAGNSGNPDGDMSDASLWAFATRRG